MRRTQALLFAGAVLCVAALAISTSRPPWLQPGSDALAEARRDGVIRIGYAVEAPYAFITPDGKVTGEATETARVIAARLGIPRVVWRLTEFGNLIEGLEARRFDVVAAGMFVTSERQRQVDFSAPVFRVGSGLLVRKGNPLALHAFTDILRSAGARVAVITGSYEEARLLQLGCPETRLVRVPDAASGRAAVREGQADGLALSAPAIHWMAHHPLAGVTEMAEPFSDGGAGAPGDVSLVGFAFRKDEPALRHAWNAELVHFLGSEEHRRTVRAFGFAESELPPFAADKGNVPQR